MVMFMIVKKDDVDHWKDIEQKYNTQGEEFRRFKARVQWEQDLITTLQSKISGTGAVVCHIKKDNNQNNTYVCVQDHRKPHYDTYTGKCYLNGELNIFILGTEVYPTKINTAYTDMPYLEAEFNGECTTIIEVHCDHAGYKYEGKGYATMMVETLYKIAKDSNCLSITGTLSEQDAKTEERKIRRNEFYKSKGFTLRFHDETQRSGSIYLAIKK